MAANPADHNMWFKTKGIRHKNRKDRTAAPIDHAVVQTTAECADYILTEARLIQGLDYLREMGYEMSNKSIGQYLKWIGQDCKQEDFDIIASNGVEWKQVIKVINNRARRYFMDIVKVY